LRRRSSLAVSQASRPGLSRLRVSLEGPFQNLSPPSGSDTFTFGTTSRKEDLPEEIGAYRKFREETPSALAILQESLEDATAILALPGKYCGRLRTTKRDPAIYSGDPASGKSNSDLSERGAGSSACWDSLHRDSRRAVDGTVLLQPGGVFRVEASYLQEKSSEDESFGGQASSTENPVDQEAAMAT